MLLEVSCEFIPCLYNILNLNNCNFSNTITKETQGVVNLSNKILSDSELSLLSKGLTFVDTPPPPDLGVLVEDLSKFHLSIRRKLAISKFQNDQTPKRPESTPFDHSKFKNPSRWNPPGPVILEHMALLNEAQILESNKIPKQNRRNMTNAEFTAKKDLANDKSIIIKKADKGSAVVVQNHSDYINEGLRQLSDKNFYLETKTDLTAKHNVLVQTEVKRLISTKEISEKTGQYLFIENPRTSKLYLLPKIHKNVKPPPGRPIVSANECPTERVSQFVDRFIQPIVSKLPAYVRDSGHFINIIKDLKLPHDAIIATLDVTSLYTNIPNNEGVESVRKYLHKERDPKLNPTNDSICRLLNLVLTTNNFDLDDKHYLQVGGIAMGTKLATSFANLFMGHFEEKFVYTYKLKPLIWKRFIDDIFFIWTYGQDELDSFVQHLNGCHKTIKFTVESSLNTINFLDITVNKEQDGSLSTTLYCKPTDSHNYLLYSSEHPRHILNGIPYSQMLRVRRICTKMEDFLANALMLSSHFIRRGYPTYLIITALKRAVKLDRDALLNKDHLSKSIPDKKSASDTFYCITTHNPKNPPIAEIVKRNWELLERTKGTRPIMDAKLIFGLRRNKNLSNFLVKASTSSKTKTTSRHINRNPCNRPFNCRYCRKINKKDKIFSSDKKREFNPLTNVNCQSSNLIYLITCKHCGIHYVGQTKNRLLTRFQGHYHDIKTKNDTTVSRHFNKCPNGKPSLFDGIRISILSFMHHPSDTTSSQRERDIEEKRWMQRLSSIVPKGLNLMD